jgi:glycosyltransferase involved in cell wall biosynthesis
VGEPRHLSQLDRDKMDELTARGIGHFVNRRVPNEDFEDYFCAADFVLLPYRKFRYSSGILANAIYSKTPVIATAKGLIGATVQQERLGYTLSSLKVSHYAQTVLDALKQPTPAITEESAAKRAPGVFVSDFQRALVSPSLATIRQ